MKKTGASDNRSGRRVCVALAFIAAVFGAAAKVGAVEHGRWPRATYFTMVARKGDTLSTIAGRYRALPSLIARVNGLGASERVTAGRVMLIPATTRATRDAVRFEAMDRSAPNYATRPGALPAIARSVFPVPVVAMPRASDRPQTAAARPTTETGKSTLRFSWPIAGPVISSFGPGAQQTRNDGINIAAERGAPFRAAADGAVSFAGRLRGYGNLILIAHSHGYVTVYAHAASIAVARGEFVEKGQAIGTAGATGGVIRPQLHFEIRRGVTPIDPSLLLAANS